MSWLSIPMIAVGAWFVALKTSGGAGGFRQGVQAALQKIT